MPTAHGRSTRREMRPHNVADNEDARAAAEAKRDEALSKRSAARPSCAATRTGGSTSIATPPLRRRGISCSGRSGC